MLVKMNLTPDQVKVMNELKLHIGENTGSKAALYAISNIMKAEQKIQELQLQLDSVVNEFSIVVHQYRKAEESKSNLRHLMDHALVTVSELDSIPF